MLIHKRDWPHGEEVWHQQSGVHHSAFGVQTHSLATKSEIVVAKRGRDDAVVEGEQVATTRGARVERNAGDTPSQQCYNYWNVAAV